MTYLWASILTLVNLFWLATVVLGLPGTWLMVVSTTLLAWWQRPDEGSDDVGMFAIPTLVVVIVLALAGEIAEFFTGVVGSAKAGGTRRGSIGALIGGFVGALAATFAIPIPILGSLIGACCGACLGALVGELTGGRKMLESAKSGVGAGFGTLAGRIVKVAAGALIWLIITIAAFWP